MKQFTQTARSCRQSGEVIRLAHITTPAGTDLYMEMNQMEPIIECGIARNPGDAMAWV